MSATPARFTFDLDLGRRTERSSLLSETAIAELVAEARSEGIRQGFADGEKSAAARAARDLAAAADALATRVAVMAAEMDDAHKAHIADAIDLAVSVARKLATSLVAREPAGEIETLFGECLASLGAVPHLVIRCAPALADAVRDIATARIATAGFTGRLVVLGDPDIGLGDARIEWADGGVVRDMGKLSDEIDGRIAAYFAAHGMVRGGNEETGG